MVNILKTIGKIVVILVIASLVTGGLYLAVQNGSISSSTTFNDRNFNTQQFQNSGSTSQPQFRPEGGDFGEGRGNFNLAQGLGGMLGALIKISIIATLVLLFKNLIVNMKRKPKASVA